jgi:putative transposon-encoded protein
MKTCFIPYSLTKITLAAVAVAVTLLAAAPAHALTSWVRGGNWASNGTNANGMIYPCGMSPSTTVAQATALADTIATDYHNVGINFVRYSINPATVTGNWAVTQAAINELIADGLSVDICCFYVDDGSGLIINMTNWKNMWQTIDGVYKNNNSVYYEVINEPFGYTLSGLESVYSSFLTSYGIIKAQSHIILGGTGYEDNVTGIGGDSAFNNCLLGVHDYAFWNTSLTTESAWESQLQGAVGTCANRTILTEFGSAMTTGDDYQVSANNNDISFLRGMCIQCRAWPMGLVYFPAHSPQLNNNKVMFTSVGGTIFNRSGVNEIEYGFNFFTPVSSPACDFNTIGQSIYSVFRPSNQKWYIYPGTGGIAYGASTDIAVPADYDADGLAEIAVWRPSSGNWYIYPSLNGIQWGLNGDIPVPGDYLGVGSAQLAVWRPSNGKWYVNGGDNGFQFGTSGDIPVPGYYKGDGHLDYAVYRPSNNTWWINGWSSITFGQAGDIPVPGDYAGNGTTQIAVFRPSDGTWRIYGGATTPFGQNGDVPVPGDYLGDDYTQMATWRPSNSVWYVNGGGTPTYGTTGDVPLPLPYAIRHSLGYNN